MISCLLVGGPADGKLQMTSSPIFEVSELQPINFMMPGAALPDEQDVTCERHIYEVRELWPHPPMKPFVAYPALFRGRTGRVEHWLDIWMRCFEAGAVMPMEGTNE